MTDTSNGWQPISTAPKQFPKGMHHDDKAIQLWALNVMGDLRWTFGFWTQDGPDGSGWWDVAERAFCTPIYWQPLPGRPAVNATPYLQALLDEKDIEI